VTTTNATRAKFAWRAATCTERMGTSPVRLAACSLLLASASSSLLASASSLSLLLASASSSLLQASAIVGRGGRVSRSLAGEPDVGAAAAEPQEGQMSRR
jgi:hypothetical protein